MDKFLRIVGVVVVAWLAIGLLGVIFGFLIKAVFFLALVAGAVYLVAALAGKGRLGSGSRPRSLR